MQVVGIQHPTGSGQHLEGSGGQSLLNSIGIFFQMGELKSKTILCIGGEI